MPGYVTHAGAGIACMEMKIARIANLEDDTSEDARTGAVRSVQAADVYMSEETLRQIWTPLHLERLARTYWRFLSRVTLGLIRVRYTERERFVVLLLPWLKLLTFRAPEYEMDAQRGVVRWRIARGLLVARAGRGKDGYLQIDVRRRPGEDPAHPGEDSAHPREDSAHPGEDSADPDGDAAHPGGNANHPGKGPARHARARLHVEVEVANFYPSIASGIGRWFYRETQSRIHVIVTHGFLRSLARLDLAESRVGRFARAEDVPDPTPPAEEELTIGG